MDHAPLTLTIVRYHHDPIALCYLHAGSTALLEDCACARPDLLAAAVRAAGATVDVVDELMPCGDDCDACRCEAHRDRDARIAEYAGAR